MIHSAAPLDLLGTERRASFESRRLNPWLGYQRGIEFMDIYPIYHISLIYGNLGRK